MRFKAPSNGTVGEIWMVVYISGAPCYECGLHETKEEAEKQRIESHIMPTRVEQLYPKGQWACFSQPIKTVTLPMEQWDEILLAAENYENRGPDQQGYQSRELLEACAALQKALEE